MIYVFGNSHAHVFTSSTPSIIGEGPNRNEYFRSFSLGPVIAYNFYENHFPTMINWINSLPITLNDYILIAIGEVDCRWHLPFQANKQNRSPKEVVHECIDRFFRAHLYLKQSGYKVIGWGGHPSTTRGHDENPSEPVFGDCLSRNAISLEWNDYLKEQCYKNDMPFISIVRDLINLDGLTRIEYNLDYCHLNPEKVMPIIIEKFKTKGIL